MSAIAEAPVQHPFIKPVEVPIEPCMFCGLRYAGATVIDGEKIETRRYVAFELQLAGGDDGVAAGTVITQRDEPGRTVKLARDPGSGHAVPVYVQHPHVCSDCITSAARVLGLPVDRDFE